MDTVDRIMDLVKSTGLSNQAIEKAAGLSNGSFSKWKKREYLPSADYILKLARYFNVSADYLFCLSDVKEIQKLEQSLTEEEALLLKAFHAASASGRFRIIQVCMNELDNTEKGVTVSAG